MPALKCVSYFQVRMFHELREMVDVGALTYPYSTRELVKIVKHLQAFPEDSLGAACGNVFAFDDPDPHVRERLLQARP